MCKTAYVTNAEMLTARQVAAKFTVTPAAVYRWAATGKLAAIRTPGGGLRFRVSDVQQFLSTGGAA